MTEQLELDLPEPTAHGVVVEAGRRVDRFETHSLDSSNRIADGLAVLATETRGVVWEDVPKTTGWYGLAPGVGGSIVHRIATY